jgi:hypothetical protein
MDTAQVASGAARCVRIDRRRMLVHGIRPCLRRRPATSLAFERYRADGGSDHPAPTIRTEPLQAADGVDRLTLEETGTWALRPAQRWARFVTHDLRWWDSFVVLPAAAPLDLVLLRPASTTGLVVDADGAPVAAASVDISLHDGFGIEWHVTGASTDERGRLQLPPGMHSVCVTSSGHATGWSAPFQVLADKEVELRLVLSAGAWLTLRCEEAQPAELSLHEGPRDVSALRAPPDFAFEGPTWSGRDARFGPLPPGRYTARARCSDGVELEHVIDVVVGARAEVVLKRP